MLPHGEQIKVDDVKETVETVTKSNKKEGLDAWL
jgi:hypothetical protein